MPLALGASPRRPCGARRADSGGLGALAPSGEQVYPAKGIETRRAETFKAPFMKARPLGSPYIFGKDGCNMFAWPWIKEVF